MLLNKGYPNCWRMIVLKTVIPFSNNFFFIKNDKGFFLVYLQNKTKLKCQLSGKALFQLLKVNNAFPIGRTYKSRSHIFKILFFPWKEETSQQMAIITRKKLFVISTIIGMNTLLFFSNVPMEKLLLWYCIIVAVAYTLEKTHLLEVIEKIAQ